MLSNVDVISVLWHNLNSQQCRIIDRVQFRFLGTICARADECASAQEEGILVKVTDLIPGFQAVLHPFP